MKTNKMFLTAFLLLVLGGCGTQQANDEGGTFAAALESSPVNSIQDSSSVDPEPLSANAAPEEELPNETSQEDNPANKANDQTESADLPDLADPASATPPVNAAPPATAADTNATPSAQEPKAPVAEVVQEEPKPNSSPVENNTPAAVSTGHPVIKWSEFFDDEQQITPSDKFWDLSEQKQTVEIQGFMGEVLSFEKRWFLLIPEPGAECPFDNGDETYWNKIMIVFVPEDTKLRYTPGPLKITGRLDVGIKVDESGYKTMFRLYDAKFEKIKE